jgi:hypothetical protein
VIGETIRTKPVIPAAAICPNCGFEQPVYVDRIISVTDDTANTLTPLQGPQQQIDGT